MNWREVTAIFGGRFDPPHLGHSEAVRGLFSRPGVGKVVVVPSASPPHKTVNAPAEHRLEMARLAFPPEVAVDSREIERARKTGLPSYSYDTLQEFRREYPQLAFVIGTDQLLDLPRWNRFPEVLGLCHWIVLERRPGGDALVREGLRELLNSGLAKPFQGSDGRTWELRGGTRLIAVPTDAPAVSSTGIREAIGRTGKPPENTLDSAVLAYLLRHRLYGSEVRA